MSKQDLQRIKYHLEWIVKIIGVELQVIEDDEENERQDAEQHADEVRERLRGGVPR